MRSLIADGLASVAQKTNSIHNERASSSSASDAKYVVFEQTISSDYLMQQVFNSVKLN